MLSEHKNISLNICVCVCLCTSVLVKDLDSRIRNTDMLVSCSVVYFYMFLANTSAVCFYYLFSVIFLLGLTAKVIDRTNTMSDVYNAFFDFSCMLKSKVF